MKKFKKLIPAMVMLLIATMLMGTTTYAWFSMNTQVTATGMEVKAVAGASLQISSTTSFTAGKIEHDFGSDAYKLYHAVKATDVSIASSSGLATITNPQDVNPSSGNVKSGATLTYQAATTEATTSAAGYYKDYVVYIAAEGTNDELNSGKLTATIPANTSISENSLNAITVLFYIDAATTPVAQINLKAGGTVDLIPDLSTRSIPADENGTRTETSAVKVTMRVFMDGTLEDSAAPGNTYVRNSAIADLTNNSVSWTVTFNKV